MMKNQSNNTARNYSESNRQLRIAIVRSNYYKDLTKHLESACREHLTKAGVSVGNIKTFAVPGSWEIPIVAKKIAQSGKFDGIVTLGIIMKGETYHFELIAQACANALMNISLEYAIPISFEVMTVYSLEQAKKRSTGKFNSGIEAAQALLQTIKAMKEI